MLRCGRTPCHGDGRVGHAREGWDGGRGERGGAGQHQVGHAACHLPARRVHMGVCVRMCVRVFWGWAPCLHQSFCQLYDHCLQPDFALTVPPAARPLGVASPFGVPGAPRNAIMHDNAACLTLPPLLIPQHTSRAGRRCSASWWATRCSTTARCQPGDGGRRWPFGHRTTHTYRYLFRTCCTAMGGLLTVPRLAVAHAQGPHKPGGQMVVAPAYRGRCALRAEGNHPYLAPPSPPGVHTHGGRGPFGVARKSRLTSCCGAYGTMLRGSRGAAQVHACGTCPWPWPCHLTPLPPPRHAGHDDTLPPPVPGAAAGAAAGC